MATVNERHPGGRPRIYEPCPLGRLIESLAAKRSMTLDALADSSGVGLRTLYDVISGKTPDPRVSTVAAIAKALNVPVGRLVKKTTASARGPLRSARRPA